MVQFDNQYRQIKIKIVYYGTALGGKTTCLQHVHRVTDPQRRTKLYSLNTASDRTLFFDLLALDLGRVRGYRLAMQLYTVPGQVQYNATRRAVLSGADGVVFVADSQADQRQANSGSLENLWENLSANGLDRDTIPLVFQYNKRDLSPLLAIDELEHDLNRRGVASFPTVAVTGDGVMEAFAAISEQTLEAVADRLGVGSSRKAVERLQEQARAALGPYVGEDLEGVPEDDVAALRPQPDGGPDEPLSQEALVDEAVRANVAMTDVNARLDTTSRMLQHKVRALEAVAEFGTRLGGERDPTAVLRRLLECAVRCLRLQGAVVLVVPGSGELREVVTHGLEADPLLRTPDGAGEPLALSVVGARRPRLIVREVDDDGDSLELAAIEGAGFASALAVPLVAQDRIVGLLTCYGDRERPALDQDDLQLAVAIGAAAAMGHANAVAWQRLEELNRGLEGQVSDRTSELRESLDKVEQLASDLAEKNRLVEDAYRELSELDRVKNELITRISHELRTPVTSLLTAAKILDRYRDAPAEKGARFVSIIRDEAAKLAEIVQSVFQASVLATTRERTGFQIIPADQLFKRAVTPLRDLAQERDVRLQVLIPSGLDTVTCDVETMEAALRAVIKNAIEFNHRGGEVTVEVRRVLKGDDPWLILGVADTGVGIPEQELAHVYDTFWQGGNVLTGKPRGVGLGLAIAKRVVENHGGTIDVASEIAEGTRVTISVPQASSP